MITPLLADAPAGEAPLLMAAEGAKAIPNQYIVVFKPGTSQAPAKASALTSVLGGKLVATYQTALQGFTAELDAEALKALQHNPDVAFIEQDQFVALHDTQNNATWGLDRADQRNLPLTGSYVYNTTAASVHAYVIDTGIRATHTEFTGRVGNGYDAVTLGGSATDCHGHGSHVAGTVGGTTYGMAKRVILHPVRVLDCAGSGTNSAVIAGVDWVTSNHIKPAVANMSLGGVASTAIDTAVNNSINAGVTYVVSAGNDNLDACGYSPARVGPAITVGATTNKDARSTFSNYGACLDIFAPGSNITSAWYNGDTTTNRISGTSMASPHVAGAVALYLSFNPSATPPQVRDALVNGATLNKVTTPGTGSPNRLLYAVFSGTVPTPTPGASQPTPTPLPPTATPTPVVGNTTIVNPGFESGSKVGWSESSALGYTLATTGASRSGSWLAWLGGANLETSQVTQNYVVPSTGGRLYYWYRITSSDYCGYDAGQVLVGDTILASYDLCSTTATSSYVQGSVNLSAYAGQTVTLRFRAFTDANFSSSFYVDDVTFSAGSGLLGAAVAIEPSTQMAEPQGKPDAPAGLTEEKVLLSSNE